MRQQSIQMNYFVKEFQGHCCHISFYSVYFFQKKNFVSRTFVSLKWCNDLIVKCVTERESKRDREIRMWNDFFFWFCLLCEYWMREGSHRPYALWSYFAHMQNAVTLNFKISWKIKHGKKRLFYNSRCGFLKEWKKEWIKSISSFWPLGNSHCNFRFQFILFFHLL